MSSALDQLLLHPKTKLQVEYMVKNPPHALLIAANTGSGKKTLARTIASGLLELGGAKNLISYPYFFHIARFKSKSDISIEQIRAVINALKLKTPGKKNIKRVVFIEDAQFLSIPAQNALLKILEEPSQDTVFLLSVNSVQNILPTIISRAQKIEIQPTSIKSALDYWQDSGHTSEAIKSAWMLSGGSVGLLLALLTKNTEHPLKKAVDEAKIFLRATKYQRILHADQLSRNKENFQLFLDALSRTLGVLHQNAVKNGREAPSRNLLTSRKILRQSSDALQVNANARLVALKLVINLKI